MKGFVTLLARELRVEARGREILTGTLPLAFLVLIVANLAWGGLGDVTLVTPGVLWVALVFAGTLGVSRNLHRERDRGTWPALAALPVDRGTVFLAKAAANAIVLLVVEAFALPLFALLFNADLIGPLPGLVPILLLGTVGFVATGTMLAAVSAHGRARQALLPILLFPLLVPLLMMCLQGTARVLAGEGLAAVTSELELLVAYDTIFLAVGWLAFDHLLEE